MDPYRVIEREYLANLIPANRHLEGLGFVFLGFVLGAGFRIFVSMALWILSL